VHAYTDERLGIHVAGPHEAFDRFEDVLVQHMAKGVNLSSDAAKKIPPQIRLKALVNAFEKWLDQAIFVDGKFHADLHPGNIFMDVTAEQLADPVALSKLTNPSITLIDMGAVGQITMPERHAFAELFTATLLRSPDQAIGALEMLGPIDAKLIPALRKDILAIMGEPKAKILEKLSQIAASAATTYNLPIPESLMRFNRSRDLLELAIKNANAELDIIDPLKKYGRVEPFEIYARTAAKRIGFQLPAELAQSAAEAVVGKMPKFAQRKLQPYMPNADHVVRTELLQSTFKDNRKRIARYFASVPTRCVDAVMTKVFRRRTDVLPPIEKITD
jgi:predicted unusual protein kinase regulating ubiquinone biosynthesis (AarF/ABC1/UbiB family)